MAMDIVRRGSRWKIGEGNEVRMWAALWLNDGISLRIHTPEVSGFEDMLVKNFYVPNSRNWDVEVI